MKKTTQRPPWQKMFWFPALLLLLLFLVLPRFAGSMIGAPIRAGQATTTPRVGAWGTAPVGGTKIPPPQAAAMPWVGTWGAAPVVGLPPANLQAATFRNVVHTSVAGSALRIQFSNVFGTQPVLISQATVALSGAVGSAVAQAATMKTLTFAGSSSITIPTGQHVSTDPLAFFVPAQSDLLITISLPHVSGPLTAHIAAEQISWYTTDGNHAADSDATAFTHRANTWYYVTSVEVQSNQLQGTLVALGDSITSGVRSTGNANHRWPDDLASRLLQLPLTQQYGVLNEGIASNRLLVDAIGPSVLHRLDSDVFEHSDVKVLILLEGINDIGDGATSDAIIAGLKQIATRVHARGIRLLVGTLTPFAGSTRYTAQKEAERQAVNAFLRAQSSGADSSPFDGVIDFDAAVRDPHAPLQLLPTYDSRDHLHPNDQGYQAMSNAITLTQLSGQRDWPCWLTRPVSFAFSCHRQSNVSAERFSLPLMASAWREMKQNACFFRRCSHHR